MTALRGIEVVAGAARRRPCKELRTVPREYYALAEAFFG